MLVLSRDHRQLLAIRRPRELPQLAGVVEVDHFRSPTLPARQLDDVDLAEHDVVVDAGRWRERDGELVLFRVPMQLGGGTVEVEPGRFAVGDAASVATWFADAGSVGYGDPHA